MDCEIERETIITKFKRNSHFINKNSLQIIVSYLKSVNNQNKRLDELIKKVNQMIIVDKQVFNEQTLNLAISLLSHKLQNTRQIKFIIWSYKFRYYINIAKIYL